MQPDRIVQASFDQGEAGEGPLDRAAPRAKFILALVLLGLVAIIQPTWYPLTRELPMSWLHLVIAAVLCLALVVARMPLGYLLKRYRAFAVPLVLISLSIPLAHGAAGWPIWAGVLVKGMLSFTIVLLLMYTTRFDRLLIAMRQCHVPVVLVAVLAATHRYLFVLLDELERMRRAQYARTFHCSRRFSWRAVVNGTRLIGMLLVRCSERAERVHAAMLARGFDGELRTGEKWR